jgi:fido (protein-threonine AMPylation protein)
MPSSSAEFEFGGKPFPEILCTEEDHPRVLFNNGIDLAQYANGLAIQWSPLKRLHFTPEIILECGRLAVKGIFACAGHWRDRFVHFNTGFAPPSSEDILQHVADFCEFANSITEDPAFAAAYVLWRIRWIHPFYDGNSRVGRSLAYVAFLVMHGVSELPGDPFIWRIMDDDYVEEYHAGFDEATAAWDGETPNVSRLRSLIDWLFIEQSGGD